MGEAGRHMQAQGHGSRCPPASSSARTAQSRLCSGQRDRVDAQVAQEQDRDVCRYCRASRACCVPCSPPLPHSTLQSRHTAGSCSYLSQVQPDTAGSWGTRKGQQPEHAGPAAARVPQAQASACWPGPLKSLCLCCCCGSYRGNSVAGQAAAAAAGRHQGELRQAAWREGTTAARPLTRERTFKVGTDGPCVTA